MKNTTRHNFASLVAASIIALVPYGALAVSAQIPLVIDVMPVDFEGHGTISVINTTTRTISVSGVAYVINDYTKLSTDDPLLSNKPMSINWVGLRIGFEWYEASNGQKVVSRLHLWSAETDFNKER